MKFEDALRTFPTILKNGPLTTRLVYDYQYNDGAFKAISDPLGRQALTEIYRGDIDIARTYHLPIIINAPTFRASKNHLSPTSDVKSINLTCLEFIHNIKSMYDDGEPIFIGAPIGSMNDAYSVDPALTIDAAKTYHQEQIDVLKEAQIDFVNALTLSSFNEALGISLAAQQCNLDYTIGFILNENGTLLDGMQLHKAIQGLDEATIKKPLGYTITCTHASTIAKLNESYPQYQRLIGAQANGSSLPARELAKMTTAVSDNPVKFADDMQQLKQKFGLIIVAGCCGTTKEHLRAIAEKFKQNLILT